MLLKRMITALILIPIVLGAVVYFPAFYFSLLAALVMGWGAYEWAMLCELDTFKASLYVVAFFIVCALLGWCQCHSLLLLGAAFWLLPSYWILTYRDRAPQILMYSHAKAVMGLVVLCTAWYGLSVIKALPRGEVWIISLLILVWACDSFAFFVGRRFGKQPLALKISPKKTIEGFYGCLIGTLVLGILMYFSLSQTGFRTYLIPFSAWISLCYITILLAVVGDLFESLLKRLCGVKDSGELLPGHGGMLDRIDSLIAVLPVFALSLVWIIK